MPVTALRDPQLEMLYPFEHFNPIQSQIFHCLYYTDNNVLLGAPTGSGKTIAAEIAMFRVFKEYPGSKVSDNQFYYSETVHNISLMRAVIRNSRDFKAVMSLEPAVQLIKKDYSVWL